MAKRVFAVVGATGHVGGTVAACLEKAGHEVRAIARSAGVSLDRPLAVAKTFAGADGAFLMVPPDAKAADLRKRQNQIGDTLARAVRTAGTRRVVFLSGMYAHYEGGTGAILGLHDVEKKLDALDIPELIHLRPAFFMENHLWGLGQQYWAVRMISEKDAHSMAYRPDVALPMVAANDVGEFAANVLTERPFQRPRAMELFGPRDYTMKEAARILGAAIGKPDLKYVQASHDEASKSMRKQGMSASYIRALIEATRGINEGNLQPAAQRSAENTLPTSLQGFAKSVFKPAFDAVLGVFPRE